MLFQLVHKKVKWRRSCVVKTPPPYDKKQESCGEEGVSPFLSRALEGNVHSPLCLQIVKGRWTSARSLCKIGHGIGGEHCCAESCTNPTPVASALPKNKLCIIG